MDSPIRSTLWSAYGVLVVLIVAGLALTVGILHLSNRQEYRIVEGSGPLLDAVGAMNDDTLAIMSAARGFALTKRVSSSSSMTRPCATSESRPRTQCVWPPSRATPSVSARCGALRRDPAGTPIRRWPPSSRAATATRTSTWLAAAKEHSAAPDYAGTMADEHARQERGDLQRITSMRSSLTLLMVIASLVVIAIAAYLIWRIQQSLIASIDRQVRRTEAMIAGMSDGVMLVDAEGGDGVSEPRRRNGC